MLHVICTSRRFMVVRVDFGRSGACVWTVEVDEDRLSAEPLPVSTYWLVYESIS